MRWHKVRNKGYEKMKREELHKLLFETLCIIDDICKKENVRWFLDSGTELGSLREQDIIPWMMTWILRCSVKIIRHFVRQ